MFCTCCNAPATREMEGVTFCQSCHDAEAQERREDAEIVRLESWEGQW